jgi:hypothetical protein
MQLQKQLPEGASLYHAVSHDAVLSLNTRTGDAILSLQGPQDEVVA